LSKPSSGTNFASQVVGLHMKNGIFIATNGITTSTRIYFRFVLMREESDRQVQQEEVGGFLLAS